MSSSNCLHVYRGDRILKDTLNLIGEESVSSLSGTEISKDIYLDDCTNLRSLGSLREVKGFLSLLGCTSLVSLGKVEIVHCYLYLAGCTRLSSIGSLKEVRGGVLLSDDLAMSGKEFIERVQDYESAPLHRILHYVTYPENQRTPFFLNQLTRRLANG